VSRETIAAVLMVWLIGAIAGWCTGWAVRGGDNRRWHNNLVRQLAQVRHELAAALDELDRLDHVRLHREAQRAPAPTPTPAAVHVHVAAPLPWPPHHPSMPLGAPRFLDAMPVLSAEEVQS
jgi:hypothetical protein